jgi:hypothetical protein
VRSLWRLLIGIMASGLSAACSFLPDLPPESDQVGLPVQEIVLRSACELRDALNSIPRYEYKHFDPTKWLIAVTLQPKVDTEITPGFGVTRVIPTTPKAPTITTLSAGASPGTFFDGKGERLGAVVYNYKSAALMKDNKLDCTPSTPSMNALAQHLGVAEWLRRTIVATEGVDSATIDKPQFNSDITIKFAASGGYSFAFPAGTNTLSLSGSYALDEQLNIAMTKVTTSTIVAITLPVGEDFRNPKNKQTIVTSTVQSAQTQMDILQLQQAVTSTQPRP